MTDPVTETKLINYASLGLEQKVNLTNDNYSETWNSGRLDDGDKSFDNPFINQASSLDIQRDQLSEAGAFPQLNLPQAVHQPGSLSTQPHFHQQAQQPLDVPQTFTVTVAAQTKNSKNLDYVTGNAAEGFTLYCKADIVVPFIFRYPAGHIAASMRIRAEFAEERDQSKPVERCPNHRFKDESVYRNHFIRTDVAPPTADYRDAHEGYCVIVPVQDSIGLSFACYSSCASICRKIVRLVFTLLAADGQSIEQASMILKVCANPHRDGFKDTQFGSRKRISAMASGFGFPFGIKREEQLFKKTIPPNYRLYNSPSEDMVFTVEIRGVEMYRRVMTMLAEAEKSSRYDAQRMEKCGIAQSPYRDISSIGGDSPIYQWLQLPGINLESFADTFHRKGIYTMANLAEQYHRELFASFGFNEEASSKLNRLYLNWYNVYKSDQWLHAS